MNMLSPFLETLETIKEKPFLYNISKVEDISFLVTGIQIGKHIYRMDEEDAVLRKFTFYFSDWVEKHFNVNSTQGWVKIIRFFSRDDSDSLTIFFKLFKDFNNEVIK